MFTSQRILPLTLFLTLVISLLPAHALGWTRIPAEVLKVVLNPFAVLGNELGEWLWPAASRVRLADITHEDVERLLQDKAEAERLLLVEQEKVQQLQQQLEQLQQLPREDLKVPIKPLYARIGLRSPNSIVGAVVLNRGAKHGVKPGTIAVYQGVNLMGRVTDDVSAVQCTMLPLSNPLTPTVEARVLPKDRNFRAPVVARRIGLDPSGDGTFIANIDKSELIQEGDDVVLADLSWPESAQGMTIGKVESVRTNDMDPLRNTIVVRPAWQVSQISQVVLKIELEDATERSQTGADKSK
jgi:cell shape-determining protein MreC